MYKLGIFFAIIAIATARPGLLAPAAYHTAIVGSIPTTISQQSNSIIHRAALVAPVVQAAPVVHAAPLVHSAPFVQAAPVVTSIAAAAPYYSAYAAPALIGHGHY